MATQRQSYRDEDDDLAGWLEAQASGAQPPAAAVPSPAPAIHPERLMQAPEPTRPQETGMGLLGDAGAEWAALLDVALNRGRGVGQILTQNAQRPQRQLDNQLKQAQIDWMNRRAAGGTSAEELELRRRSADMRERSLDQADTREARLTEKAKLGVKQFEAKYGKGSPEVAAIKNYFRTQGVPDNVLNTLDDMSMSGVNTVAPSLRKDTELAKTPQIATAEGEKAQARTAGKIQAEIDYEPQTTEAARKKAAAVAEATEESKIRVAGGSASARVQGEQAGRDAVGDKMRIPGLKRTDEAVAAQSLGDDATRRKLQDMSGAFGEARDGLRRMIALRETYGTELPGYVKSRFDMAQVAINGALTEIGRTGVLSNDERAYYMAMVPNLSAGWTDALRPGGTDIKLQQLKGSLDEFTDLGNRKFKPYGHAFDDGAGQPEQPKAAEPAPAAPAPQPPAAEQPVPEHRQRAVDALEGLLDDKDIAGLSQEDYMRGLVEENPEMRESGAAELPVQKPIPPKPGARPRAQPSAAARKYSVSMPGKPTLEKTLTQDQVEALIAADAKVVPVR